MSEKRKIEFPLVQLYGLISTIIGVLLWLYFSILLNNRLSAVDFQRPIYGWSEILEAVPYGGIAVVFGIILVLLGIGLSVYGNIVIKRNRE